MTKKKQTFIALICYSQAKRGKWNFFKKLTSFFFYGRGYDLGELGGKNIRLFLLKESREEFCALEFWQQEEILGKLITKIKKCGAKAYGVEMEIAQVLAISYRKVFCDYKKEAMTLKIAGLGDIGGKCVGVIGVNNFGERFLLEDLSEKAGHLILSGTCAREVSDFWFKETGIACGVLSRKKLKEHSDIVINLEKLAEVVVELDLPDKFYQLTEHKKSIPITLAIVLLKYCQKRGDIGDITT